MIAEKQIGSPRKLAALLVLDRISTYHKVALNPAEALLYAKLAETYNGHTNEGLLRMVSEINRAIPPVCFPDVDGAPNPNNGSTHHEFQVGAEGSRVIYVRIIKSYWPGGNYGAFGGLLESVAKAANVDEFDIEENGECEFKARFWWD